MELSLEERSYIALNVALIKLKLNGPEYRGAGICHNVRVTVAGLPAPYDGRNVYACSVDIMDSLFQRWSEFSGFTTHPVKAYLYTHASTEYNRRTLWTRWTRYGRARYRLLDYLINETNKWLVENHRSGCDVQSRN